MNGLPPCGGGIRQVLMATIVVLATGCTIPMPKADQPVSKVAATRAEAELVYERYREVRQSALELVDAQPLTAIESGPVLAIDTGALQVARRLQAGARPDASQDLQMLDVLTPRLDDYPLWYLVVARDGVRDRTMMQVFARPTSTSTWQLVASPETLSSTRLLELATDETGALVSVDPGSASGLAMAPSDVLTTYADALQGPTAPANESITQDSFVQQMRDVVAAQSAIRGVTFSQRWSSRPVEYALRAEDGGALVVATLERHDRYRIDEGTAVDWPEGSEQKAFLAGSLYSSATLRYFHQLLMYVPPEDGGAPFVLGQYGGVVGAEGLPGGGQPRPSASGPNQASIAMEAPIRAAPATRHRRR